MTRETAERVAQILQEIDTLKSMRKELFRADNISGHINSENCGLGFCWKKGTHDGKYIQYIIDGIESEIAQLEYEIKHL